MKKLMAFLMFLSATTMGAAAQEVSGLTQPITPSYSDILMMKAMASSDVLATPVMLSPMPMSFAVEQPLAYGYDASHTEATSMEVSKNLSFTAVGNYRSYIGLMDVQSVSGGVQYSLGDLTGFGFNMRRRNRHKDTSVYLRFFRSGRSGADSFILTAKKAKVKFCTLPKFAILFFRSRP